jgi:hypothetical protein
MTPEEHARVLQHGAALSQVKTSIDALKKAGVDTSSLETEYTRVSNLRQGMLTHLAPPAVRNRRGTTAG